MPMVKTRDGASVFFRVLGRGQPVLLLHGFAMDSRQWFPLVAPYLKQFRFILPDFRGHGRSSLGAFHRSQAIESLCSDLDDILDRLKLDRVMLGAYSLGALVGLEYALRWGARRIERYLHIELGPCFSNRADWQFGFNEAMKERASQLVNYWSAHPEAGLTAASGLAAYRTLVHEMVRQAFPQTWVQHVLGAIPGRLLEPLLPDPMFTLELFSYLLTADYDLRGRIPELAMPGMIMSGRQSRYFPWEAMEWMHETWEKSQHLVFDHSGHGLMYSEPLKFRKAFQCFLQGDVERVHEAVLSRRWLGLRTAG